MESNTTLSHINQKLDFCEKRLDIQEFNSLLETREVEFTRELKSLVLNTLPGYEEISHTISFWVAPE